MKRFASLLTGVLCVVALAVGVVAASAAPSRTWSNDFEQAGDDSPSGSWYDNPPGTIDRAPSGYVSPAGYGSGIQSAHRRWHARLHDAGCDTTRFASTCYGPLTRWGKSTSANATFPDGGYMTEVDVYLDVPWVASGGGKADYRFDWSSAINDNTGNHRRDFVFNVGTPLTAAEALTSPGYYINASTNATRSGAFPENPCPNPSTAPNYCRTPVKIMQSGWYTFRHRFYRRSHNGTDYLAVDFTVLRHDGTVMGNWFISVTDDQDPLNSDRMTRVGGDRYGWFVINEIEDLAIDCSNLRPPSFSHPALRASCSFGREGGGHGGGDGEHCDRNDDSDHAEHQELDRMNRERSAAMLPPLTMNTSSSSASREHSCDEHNHGEVDERGSDGSMSSDRMRAAGVPFTVNAESLAVAYSDTGSDALSTIESDLLDDVTWRANVLNPLFTQVGIGVVYLDGEMYLTEDFTG